MAHLTHDYVGKILTGCKSTAKLLNHKTLASLFAKRHHVFFFHPFKIRNMQRRIHTATDSFHIRFKFVMSTFLDSLQVRSESVTYPFLNLFQIRHEFVLPPFCLRSASATNLPQTYPLSGGRTESERRDKGKQDDGRPFRTGFQHALGCISLHARSNRHSHKNDSILDSLLSHASFNSVPHLTWKLTFR